VKHAFLALVAFALTVTVARADSLNVRLVGSCDTPGSALRVVVAGNYAYVADYTAGLRIISVSDPTHPTEVGYCNTPGDASGVAVAGNYAYVADFAAGLRVISVSDPTHPTEVGYCNTSNACGVVVAGNHAYVADYTAGLRVISVSDPAHPVEVGYYGTADLACGVAVVGDYAYVAAYDAGLQICEFYGAGIEEGRQPMANGVRPTVTVIRGVLFLSEASGEKREARGELLDISGRKVLDIRAGANDVSRLAPGVYFVHEAQARAVHKIIVQN
jgi:hypothetical protein